MSELPPVIAAYISAYNSKDVDGMLDCLSDDIAFRNLTGKEVTAQAAGKPEFEAMARFGASAFETRSQTVVHAITVDDTTAADIAYTAVVGVDLPNGWKQGQQLSFAGASLFHVRDGVIVSIVDQT